MTVGAGAAADRAAQAVASPEVERSAGVTEKSNGSSPCEQWRCATRAAGVSPTYKIVVSDRQRAESLQLNGRWDQQRPRGNMRLIDGFDSKLSLHYWARRGSQHASGAPTLTQHQLPEALPDRPDEIRAGKVRWELRAKAQARWKRCPWASTECSEKLSAGCSIPFHEDCARSLAADSQRIRQRKLCACYKTVACRCKWIMTHAAQELRAAR